MAIYSLIKLISFSILLLLGSSSAQLDINYYYSSCPELSTTVKSVVESAIQKEPRMGASLLRLFFHDCFVNGCDGSVLLDDTPSFTGEKTAKPNKGSIRGFEVIDQIKSSLEEICPGVVSCADILAVTARDSVVLLGGPDWDVKVGRKDSTTASLTSANNDLPQPSSDLDTLISKFTTKGLSAKDMVALSGAHTIGKASCANFRSHIYNDSNVNFLLAASKENICPQQSGKGDTNLAPLDIQSETVFDSGYYQNLVTLNGLLHSDQELFNGGPTDLQVVLYSTFTGSFFEDFVSGMVKMGDISPLTGLSGEIRKNCRNIN